MKKSDLIQSLCNGSLTAHEIAKETGASLDYVREVANKHPHLSIKKYSPIAIGLDGFGLKNQRVLSVFELCDGVRTSSEIALILGENKKYVQKVMLKFDFPRRKRGSATSSLNGQYKTGRRIDRDGYVLVSAPEGHPYARNRRGRVTGVIYEHRLLMEDKLQRYLTPLETVDHIDGLRLHNSLDNLRLFSCNSEHIKTTLTGCIPRWSKAGLEKLSLPNALRSGLPQIHTYLAAKKSGDARLIQILLAALKLGEDSPFLLGSSHHLKKAGIVDLSRSNLELELEKLYRKYA